MDARLTKLEGEHDALLAEMQAMEAEQRAMQQEADTAAIERRRARSAHDDLSARVSQLEVPKLDKPAKRRPGQPDPDARYAATVGDAHTRGPSDALVTIVMFEDFQCPFCARAVETMKEIEKEYGQDVRFVFKHNPLPMHRDAKPAALAAEAAGRQGKFWKMHDLMFENTRKLEGDDLLRYAKKLRLNRKRFKRDMKDQALETKIDAHQKQASQLGARGTPAFFINGRFLSGARPFEAFAALIDEELAHARALVEAGTARADVYDTLMRDARSQP